MQFNVPTIDVNNYFYFFAIETMPENGVSKQTAAQMICAFGN